MPVADEEWGDLEPVFSQTETVLQFLEENHAQGYSHGEIMDEFTTVSEDENAIAYSIIGTYYRSLLEHLSTEGDVEERRLETEGEDGETRYISYYRAKEAGSE